EADQDHADLAAVGLERPPVRVLVAQFPSGEAVAGEVDIEIRHDLVAEEVRGDAVAEDPIGAVADDGGARRLELRRRRAGDAARRSGCSRSSLDSSGALRHVTVSHAFSTGMPTSRAARVAISLASPRVRATPRGWAVLKRGSRSTTAMMPATQAAKGA